MTDTKLADRFQRFFWALAIVLAFAQAWVCRFAIVNDTISYLDIGDYIWRGNWSAAVNGLWNPFYPVLLGGTLALLHPTSFWEYPVVHLLLFIVFVVTLWFFSLFLKELMLLRRETDTGEEYSVAEWIWIVLGYTLFLWSSLRLIGVGETNPDMLVAAAVYLASAMLVRMRRGVAAWPTYVIFGVTLGLGYLTKSAMFPISVLMLLIAFVVGLPYPGNVRKVCVAAIAFIVVSDPFIVALSNARGRLTFGDSDRYNYAVHVNDLPPLHWQGLEPGSGTPRHPTRQLLNSPATYEFGTPLGGTYPPWYDPTYWYAGVKTHLELHKQLHIMKYYLRWEETLIFGFDGIIACGLFILFFVSGRKTLIVTDVARYWFVLVPSLAALVLYSLVHVESRYVAGFVVIVALCLFFSVHLPQELMSHRLYPAVAVLLLLTFLSYVLLSPGNFIAPLDPLVLSEEYSTAHNVWRPFEVQPGSYQQAVDDLYRIGIRRGDRIASLDCSLLGVSMLARLARIKIVAEINYWPQKPDAANDFWQADSATQSRVIEALAGTGARAIISELAPSGSALEGWHRVGMTRYYIYWLAQDHAG